MAEKRSHIRFPMMQNVGEPVELKVISNGKKISIPGYIMDLSAGGLGMLTLGKQSSELAPGTPFMLDLKLPDLNSHNVEGQVVRIEKGKRAKIHHSNDEWFLSLRFTNVKSSLIRHLNRMAEDWSICETKIQMRLPDVCFKECSYWGLCEKSVKLKE